MATSSPGNPGDQPEQKPPGTSDIVVRSPTLAAPWDYGPEAIDLRGAQFSPRLRPPRRRPAVRPGTSPESDIPVTTTRRGGGRA